MSESKRHCEFCNKPISNKREKFGQAYFYYCDACEQSCSSVENLKKVK